MFSEPMDGVKLTLDCAQAEFLTPERAVISLKGGELYVLTLIKPHSNLKWVILVGNAFGTKIGSQKMSVHICYTLARCHVTS